MEGTRQGEQVGQWVWSKWSQPKESKENIVASKRQENPLLLDCLANPSTAAGRPGHGPQPCPYP